MSASELLEALRKNRRSVVSFRSATGIERRPFARVYEDVERVAAALPRGGEVRPRVGFLARNGYEFLLLDLACLLAGCHSVPLPYDEYASKLASAVSQLALDVCFADAGAASTDGAPSVEPFSELMAAKDAALPAAAPARPFEDGETFSTIFTSGSTGSPKPIEVRFECVDEFVRTCVGAFEVTSDDSVAVFLPFTQFSSRLYMYGAISAGFDIVISTPARILFDLKDFSPTILQGIPYFFESIHASMTSAMRESRFGPLAYSALAVAERVLPRAVCDALGRRLFSGVHSFWGGRMRLLVTGAAPVRRDVLEFFNRVGIPMYEAYGLVETGVITMNVPGASRIGSVGRVVPGKEITLEEDGQVSVRGRHLWGRRYEGAPPALNDRVFRPDGSIATGDVGYLDDDGYLFLLGRKDETIVLRSGHKVYPAVVEGLLMGVTGIKQAAVFGGERSSLVCVVAPAAEATSEDELRRRVEAANRELGKGVQVRGVVRAREPFSLENGQLTPNLKLNRAAIYAAYRSEIEATCA